MIDFSLILGVFIVFLTAGNEELWNLLEENRIAWEREYNEHYRGRINCPVNLIELLNSDLLGNDGEGGTNESTVVLGKVELAGQDVLGQDLVGKVKGTENMEGKQTKHPEAKQFAFEEA